MVSDFYEFGWNRSFHFAPLAPDESVVASRFLAEHGNRHARNGCGEFHEAMVDHAIPDDNHLVAAGIGAWI